jgi:hypothetical protein
MPILLTRRSKINRQIGLVLSVLALLPLCNWCIPSTRTNMRGLVINNSLKFQSSKERQQTERRALAGDEEEALRLGEYCFLIEENLSAAKYWCRVAASHGSQRGKANLASLNRVDTKEWDEAHRKVRKD